MSDWLSAERRAIADRLDALPHVNTELRHRAEALLSERLSTWWGSSTPPEGKVRDEILSSRVVEGDPAELLIVRAVSTTPDTCVFGLSRTGAVYSLKRGAVAGDDFHVFVTGLSPLLDGAAVMMQERGVTGHARLFERDGRFCTAEATLFEFRTPEPSVWRRILSAVQFWHQPNKTLILEPSSGRQKDADSSHLTIDDPLPAPSVVRTVHINAPNPGVFKQMGYTVGKDGLGPLQRQVILNQIFLANLIPTSETRSYVAEFGPPASEQRLAKMRGFLWKMIETRRTFNVDYSEAIADWRDDLNWLDEHFR